MIKIPLFYKKKTETINQPLALKQPQIKSTQGNSRSHRITEAVAEEEEMVNLTQNFENLVNYGNISNNKISEQNFSGKFPFFSIVSIFWFERLILFFF